MNYWPSKQLNYMLRATRLKGDCRWSKINRQMLAWLCANYDYRDHIDCTEGSRYWAHPVVVDGLRKMGVDLGGTCAGK